MFIFLLQLREFFIATPEIYLFSIASALVWVLWIVKVLVSRRYRSWRKPYSVGTSVIIPVVDEPLDLFREVLSLIVEQRPTEVIVVINGARNKGLENVCAEFPSVECLWTPIAGKRNAVKLGVEASTQPISVLVDSDTIWTRYSDDDGIYETLPELVKPFADPTVGGVTTRQRILKPERGWLTRWADWLENTRALYAMPTQSVFGQVGCLPGRTIAFRREILIRCMDQFMNERFLGVRLEVSDDRTLTNYTLKQGYRTVYQYNSLVYTDAPTKIRKLFKQQLRWARGSQYNTMRMLPWMVAHAPMLAVFFIADIILPFLLVGATLGWVYRAVTHTGTNFYQPLLDQHPGWQGIAIVVGLIVGSSWTSALVRQARHLRTKPSDALRLPVYILASTLCLMPLRILGFVRQAHVAGWGTRAGAYDADNEATTSAPLDDRVVEMHSSTDASSGAIAVLERRKTRATRTRSRARARRRINPQAAIPYLIALAIFALEALVYVEPTSYR